MMRFLWSGSDEVRKIAWVSWEHICKPKWEGGLGVKDLYKLNVSLLGKWRWRMIHERGKLWYKILWTKYGSRIPSKSSTWWKDLNKCCVGVAAVNWFESYLCRRIGGGDATLFWLEDWHGKGKFKDTFPDLFGV